jgi:hypothetical protein
VGDLSCREIKPNKAIISIFSHHGDRHSGRKRSAQAAIGQAHCKPSRLSGLSPGCTTRWRGHTGLGTRCVFVINLETARALGSPCPHAARPRRRRDRIKTQCLLRGRSRRFRNVRDESAHPPIAAPKRTWPQVALVPEAAVSNRSKAAPYSITSSARASSVGGTVRPSVFAVVRFMTRSNLVGCSTGMSAGFAPRKILSTKLAARRKRSGMLGP